jgi:methyl-accepting chemotaxis protein
MSGPSPRRSAIGFLDRLLGRVSVRTKLASIAGIFVVVIAGVMFFSTASSVTYSTRDLQANIEGRQSTLVERYVSEVFLASQGFRADPQQTADELVSTADALLHGGKVTAVQGNDQTIAIAPVTDPIVRIKLLEEQKRVQALLGLGNKVLSLHPSAQQYRPAVNQLLATSYMVANVAYDAVGRSTRDAAAALDANAKTQQIIALAGIVVALLFSWVVTRSILTPLSEVLDVYRRMAAGDLTANVDVASSDELGRMGQGLNQVLHRLRTGMRTLGSSVLEMTSASGQLSDVSDAMEESVRVNASTADRVAGTTSTMGCTVDGLATEIAELRSQTTTIAAHAHDASEVAASAELAGQAITTSVGQLGEAGAQIAGVAEIIARIAQQTNFLALNATIEAARAGEAGAGFSVVANEVKELAGKTAQATEQIASTIGAIQDRVDEAITASESITPIVQAVRERQARIVDAVEHQKATAGSMAQGIEDLVKNSTGIHDDAASMIHTNDRNMARAKETSGAAGNLATMAERVRTVVDDWEF